MATRTRFSIHLRGFISLLTALSFLVMTVSGIILFIVPQGRIASWVDWRLLGLTKTQWGDMHITTSLLFAIAGLWHTWLNWRALVSYFKDRVSRNLTLRRELVLATVLTLFFTIGALYKTPPLSYILELNESVKEYWVKTAEDEPPVAHAELLPLSTFLKKADLELEPSLKILAQHRISIKGPDQKLGDIASRNNTSPAALFKLLNQTAAASTSPAAPGDTPVPLPKQSPPSPSTVARAPAKTPEHWTAELVESRFEGSGFGRKRLADICSELKLDQAAVIGKLAARKITAKPEETLKQIAERHQEAPLEILKIILVNEPLA